MRFLVSTVIACLIALVSAPVSAASGDSPKGFRDAAWGSKPASSLKKLSGPTSDGTTLYVPAKAKSLGPLLGIPVAEEAYSYTNGKFYAGNAWLDGKENFEKMKAALLKAYGQPTFKNEQSMLWKWKWPNSKVEVHLSYQEKFAKTTVAFLNDGV